LLQMSPMPSRHKKQKDYGHLETNRNFDQED
jgi:hypothetical protein